MNPPIGRRRTWLLLAALVVPAACDLSEPGPPPQALSPNASQTTRSSGGQWPVPAERRWHQLHVQRSGDAVFFKRQRHAGSAFDTRRRRIVIFGSDTHGRDWTNTPYYFSIDELTWRRLYPPDPPASYRVNPAGLPVAGQNTSHPWAMHTFGAVEYDPGRDQLIVSSYPGHMVPGRFSNALAHLWNKVQRHPTWTLDMRSGKWRALSTKAVHFFPYATAFDSRRAVVVGYRPNGVFELRGEPRRWDRILTNGLLGYHNNAVYDEQHRKLVVMGSHENSNEIVVYDPQRRQQRKMPTTGIRPPPDQHIPMAYHAGLGKTVALIDKHPPGVASKSRDNAVTQTWLYDLGSDEWEQVMSANLPFGCGMNYNLEYDPQGELLLLVTSEPGKPTSVWALKL